MHSRIGTGRSPTAGLRGGTILVSTRKVAGSHENSWRQESSSTLAASTSGPRSYDRRRGQTIGVVRSQAIEKQRFGGGMLETCHKYQDYSYWLRELSSISDSWRNALRGYRYSRCVSLYIVLSKIHEKLVGKKQKNLIYCYY